MKNFVLSPEVYIAASVTLDGPAAELANLWYSKRDKVTFNLSPWLKKEIVRMMVERGFSEEKATDQANFITSLGKEVPDPEGGGDPLVKLAKAVGIEKVHVAGYRTDEEEDGVKFVPVHELITELKAM